MRFAQAEVSLPCDEHLDTALEEVHAGAAVFAIRAREGEPYLGKTSVLRRRLKRLLRKREQLSRALNLRDLAERVDFWPVASRLESALVLYELAREYLPDRYLDFLKLRMPPYVKLVLGNEYPRTHVTARLTGGPGRFYGPFRTRAAAELFEHQFLDLFQLRRCQEDLQPHPDHPGCIYGEMSMCLRPCQQVVTPFEYGSEVARVSDFLLTNGLAALHNAESVRDRMSAELEFEEAARQHKRVERIQAVLKLRDELVHETDSISGVAVLPSVLPGCVSLWFVRNGAWLDPVTFEVANTDQSLSMDRRLREITAVLPSPEVTPRQRQEHLAILARWFYSSWRDGVWIDFDAPGKFPYRRLVGAISRLVHESPSAASQ